MPQEVNLFSLLPNYCAPAPIPDMYRKKFMSKRLLNQALSSRTRTPRRTRIRKRDEAEAPPADPCPPWSPFGEDRRAPRKKAKVDTVAFTMQQATSRGEVVGGSTFVFRRATLQ